LREFSLNKQDKLLKSKEYQVLRFSGKKIENKDFILVYKINELINSRLGITVSKKVGCAVERNRIKRIIREFFRINRSMLFKHVDLNFIAKKSASFKQSHNLFKSLKEVTIKIDN